MQNILNIWRKELMDSLRDKKALRQALLMPLVIGVIYAVMNPMMSSLFEERARKPVNIPAQGIENAPADFLTALAQFEIYLQPYDGDLSAVIAAGKEGVGIIIPTDFGDSIAAEKPAALQLLTNPAAGGIFGGSFSSERLDLAINAYTQQIIAQRMGERNLDTSILQPVNVQAQNLASKAQMGGLFASFMLPMLVVFVVVQGGLFVAIDVTAGEKERGTLEALLLTPASDLEVFVGKWMAVFTVSVVPFVLTLLGYWVAARLLPESMRGGGELPFAVIGGAIMVGIPVALFMSAILMAISVRTKTFKDAQSAATPLNLVAIIPAFAAAFAPAENVTAYLIPLYGPAAFVGKMASNGGQFEPLGLLFAILGSLAMAVVGALIAYRLFNRERLLYSA